MLHQHTMTPSTVGSVMLDIGGDVGALVLYVPAAELGREIEVSPIGSGTRTHAAVRERRVAAGSRCCVVYAALTAGDYTVWYDEDMPAGTVTVAGGRVTEVDWSTVF